MANERKPIQPVDILGALREVDEWIDRRLKKKGTGAFIGPHESLGIITEEYTELIDAVQSDDPAKIYHEQRDLAVAAVLAMCSIRTMRGD